MNSEPPRASVRITLGFFWSSICVRVCDDGNFTMQGCSEACRFFDEKNWSDFLTPDWSGWRHQDVPCCCCCCFTKMTNDALFHSTHFKLDVRVVAACVSISLAVPDVRVCSCAAACCATPSLGALRAVCSPRRSRSWSPRDKLWPRLVM